MRGNADRVEIAQDSVEFVERVLGADGPLGDSCDGGTALFGGAAAVGGEQDEFFGAGLGLVELERAGARGGGHGGEHLAGIGAADEVAEFVGGRDTALGAQGGGEFRGHGVGLLLGRLGGKCRGHGGGGGGARRRGGGGGVDRGGPGGLGCGGDRRRHSYGVRLAAGRGGAGLGAGNPAAEQAVETAGVGDHEFLGDLGQLAQVR